MADAGGRAVRAFHGLLHRSVLRFLRANFNCWKWLSGRALPQGLGIDTHSTPHAAGVDVTEIA